MMTLTITNNMGGRAAPHTSRIIRAAAHTASGPGGEVWISGAAGGWVLTATDGYILQRWQLPEDDLKAPIGGPYPIPAEMLLSMSGSKFWHYAVADDICRARLVPNTRKNGTDASKNEIEIETPRPVTAPAPQIVAIDLTGCGVESYVFHQPRIDNPRPIVTTIGVINFIKYLSATWSGDIVLQHAGDGAHDPYTLKVIGSSIPQHQILIAYKRLFPEVTT